MPAGARRGAAALPVERRNTPSTDAQQPHAATPTEEHQSCIGPAASRACGMTSGGVSSERSSADQGVGGGGGVTPTPEELGLSGSGIRLLG